MLEVSGRQGLQTAINLLLLSTLYMTTALSDEAKSPARPERPAAYWKFDSIENNCLNDEIGKHPALLRAAAGQLARLVRGISGNALFFSTENKSFVEVKNLTGFYSPKNQLTVMAWIKIRKLMDNWHDIVSHQNVKWQNDPTSGFRLSHLKDRLYFYIGDGSRSHVCISPEGSLPVGKWVHIAGSYNGKYLKCYVNAVEKSSTRCNCRIASQTRSLIIGDYIGADKRSVYPFYGSIDEVRIYNIALNDEQIYQAAQDGLIREKPAKK